MIEVALGSSLTDMHTVVLLLIDEWNKIKMLWRSFIVVSLIEFGALWFILSNAYSFQLGNKDSQIALLQSQLVVARVDKSAPQQFASTERTITDPQREIIRHRVLSGGKVKIVTFQPGEPARYGRELATALEAASASILFDYSSMIMNGQSGLLVYFNHNDQIASSVFSALRDAHLEPIDSGSLDGVGQVLIRIAPAS